MQFQGLRKIPLRRAAKKSQVNSMIFSCPAGHAALGKAEIEGLLPGTGDPPRPGWGDFAFDFGPTDYYTICARAVVRETWPGSSVGRAKD